MKKMDIKVRSMPYGAMVWWDRNENAADYIVKLYIEKSKNIQVEEGKGRFVNKWVVEKYQLIDEIIKEKNTCYHSFVNLADISRILSNTTHSGFGIASGTCYTETGDNYYVSVEVEDKQGNIIAESEKIRFVVETK